MGTVQEYIKKTLDQTKRKARRNDLEPGLYVASVLSLIHERREKREKLGKVLWVDLLVDEAEGDGANKPGSKLELFFNLEGAYADYAFKDLKDFLCELTGCAEEEASTKFSELVDEVNDEGKHSNPKQLARGMKIGIKTRTNKVKSGKNAGKEKTYPIFMGVDQTPSDVAENRKRLDALATEEKAAA